MAKQGYAASQVYVAGDAENDTTMFPLTLNSYTVGTLADQRTIQAGNYHVLTVGELLKKME